MPRREIETHKINGVNEVIRVYVEDEHNCHYKMYFNIGDFPAQMGDIKFHKGPLEELGPKGITNEVLIAVVLDRLEAFQKSKFQCPENAGAIQHLKLAMEALHSRTKERIARGVEGSLEV